MKRYAWDEDLEIIRERSNGEFVSYETAKALRDALEVAIEGYEHLEMYKAASKLRKIIMLADEE